MKKINNINFILLVKTKFGSIALTAFSLNRVIINTVNEENIDDKEEYLNIKETTTQVKINRRLSPYENAIKIPR